VTLVGELDACDLAPVKEPRLRELRFLAKLGLYLLWHLELGCGLSRRGLHLMLINVISYGRYSHSHVLRGGLPRVGHYEGFFLEIALRETSQLVE